MRTSSACKEELVPAIIAYFHPARGHPHRESGHGAVGRRRGDGAQVDADAMARADDFFALKFAARQFAAFLRGCVLPISKHHDALSDFR
jgi:hypothetical protein